MDLIELSIDSRLVADLGREERGVHPERESAAGESARWSRIPMLQMLLQAVVSSEPGAPAVFPAVLPHEVRRILRFSSSTSWRHA